MWHDFYTQPCVHIKTAAVLEGSHQKAHSVATDQQAGVTVCSEKHKLTRLSLGVREETVCQHVNYLQPKMSCYKCCRQDLFTQPSSTSLIERAFS